MSRAFLAAAVLFGLLIGSAFAQGAVVDAGDCKVHMGKPPIGKFNLVWRGECRNGLADGIGFLFIEMNTQWGVYEVDFVDGRMKRPFTAYFYHQNGNYTKRVAGLEPKDIVTTNVNAHDLPDWAQLLTKRDQWPQATTPPSKP